MRTTVISVLFALLCVLPCEAAARVSRILVIGDSMTGWVAERLGAYGALNGFEVSTVVWDGSTLTKWVNTGKIPSLIAQNKPDVVFVCLGLNELLVRDPGARMSGPLEKFNKQMGSVPYVWIGPPTWPGKGTGEAFNKWMQAHIAGHNHYFNSQGLRLARQSATNPHPTRAACARWADDIAKWLPSTGLGFPTLKTPPAGEMKRGKSYTYRRMKQSL